MTKPTGVGRGGKRPGAGRKKVPAQPRTPRQVAEAIVPSPRKIAALLKGMTFDQLREMARERAVIAIDTLQDVALNDERGSARVAAADKLLGWAFDKPKPGAKTEDDDKPPAEPEAGSWASLIN